MFAKQTRLQRPGHGRLTHRSSSTQYFPPYNNSRRGRLGVLHKKHRDFMRLPSPFFPRSKTRSPENPAPAASFALAVRAGNFRAHSKRPRPFLSRRLFNHRGRLTHRLTKSSPPFHRERTQSVCSYNSAGRKYASYANFELLQTNAR